MIYTGLELKCVYVGATLLLEAASQEAQTTQDHFPISHTLPYNPGALEKLGNLSIYV